MTWEKKSKSINHHPLYFCFNFQPIIKLLIWKAEMSHLVRHLTVMWKYTTELISSNTSLNMLVPYFTNGLSKLVCIHIYLNTYKYGLKNIWFLNSSMHVPILCLVSHFVMFVSGPLILSADLFCCLHDILVLSQDYGPVCRCVDPWLT